MNTTKSELTAQLKRVIDRTGVPFSLSINHPGDGYTRYQLVVRDPNTGGEHNIGRTFLGKSDMYDALRLVEECLIAKEYNEKEIES